MCSPSQWCHIHTHHPLPNQQIWLQLAGGEVEAACAAQLRNNLLNHWQWALIPHSAHSLHCLCKRKQHHTSLRFNRPATLFKHYLDHMPRRRGARKQFGRSGQEIGYSLTMALLRLGRLMLVFVVSVVWMAASTFKVRKILKTGGQSSTETSIKTCADVRIQWLLDFQLERTRGISSNIRDWRPENTDDPMRMKYWNI